MQMLENRTASHANSPVRSRSVHGMRPQSSSPSSRFRSSGWIHPILESDQEDSDGNSSGSSDHEISTAMGAWHGVRLLRKVVQAWATSTATRLAARQSSFQAVLQLKIDRSRRMLFAQWKNLRAARTFARTHFLGRPLRAWRAVVEMDKLSR